MVCIWYKIAHTAYTVMNIFEGDRCLGDLPSDLFVLKRPNEDNRGGGYYCVIGTCRSKGDDYWVKDGRPGGP